MALKYKFNVLARLKDAGYSTYRIREEKIMNEAAVAQLRNGEMVSWKCISIICELLGCQVGDIVEYISDTAKPQEQLQLQLQQKEEPVTIINPFQSLIVEPEIQEQNEEVKILGSLFKKLDEDKASEIICPMCNHPFTLENKKL